MSDTDQTGSERVDIIIGCQCGKNWWMDYQPTPETCVGDIWRLGVIDEEASRGEGIKIAWGAWVDQDGNEVYIRPSVWTEDMLVRVIVHLAEKLGPFETHLPEDVQDCVDWARGIYGTRRF